ncbi:MAG TPA: hypothetical protein PKY50_06735 [Candidatus Competibacter sp.]|nr:hypothetical protein [Candidatus Competibacter sp.]
MNTRQELLACVRSLPRESGRSIAPDVWVNFRAGWHGPVLARARNAGDVEYGYEPPTDSDLCLRYISRQKLIEFAPGDDHTMSALNAELVGNRRYPFISNPCGTFANVVYEAIRTAITGCQTSHATQAQARVRDELWAIEVVGRQGQDLKHVLYLWLVDREGADGHLGQGGYSAWLVHEVRHDLMAPDQPCRTRQSRVGGRRIEDPIPHSAMSVPVVGTVSWGAAYRA